jgi:1-deoxy-D-xylulose-5-phosphate synthase
MTILERIDSPQALKSLTIRELRQLAHEIREEIIEVVSKTGGHLAPSLGAVELTLALHRVFDAPKDKIIWDVGHQSYAHKLITGRREEFHTLRQHGGISGFPTPRESEYDAYGVGHASTAISAALGMAAARDLLKKNFQVIAVVGDGALTGGMSFEGLNQTGFMRTNLTVVLNDNGMSISENVGGIARYLNRLITTPTYTYLKSDIWELLGKLPTGLSTRARDVARKLKEGLKSFAVPTILFEELGFRYIGPLDGHDIKMLIDKLKFIKKTGGPTFLHVITEKGRGYAPAAREPSKFHGTGSFDKQTGKSIEKPVEPGLKPTPTYTEVFGNAMVEFGKQDKRIVGVTAAMPEGTGLDKFARAFPERFFDVGIAEQHAITFAAGLAMQGLKPVCAIYSTFLQRGFDQILHDVCLQHVPIVFAIDRGGIVGADGPTHHGTFDLSFLRCIPDLVIAAPKDGDELKNMLYTAINFEKGPFAIRYPRCSLPKQVEAETAKKSPLQIEIGKSEVLKQGKLGTIVAVGSMVYTALEVARKLDVGVVNARFVKPLDEELLKQIAVGQGFPSVSLGTGSPARKIITIEENTSSGGFGSAVLEFFNGQGISTQTDRIQPDSVGIVSLLRIALPDQFIEHGSRDLLFEKYGLSPSKIRKKIAEFLKQ